MKTITTELTKYKFKKSASFTINNFKDNIFSNRKH